MSAPDLPAENAPDFLRGGGTLGAQMRSKRWEATPLGPPAQWPQSLRTIIRILLTSRYQMWMGWGSDLTFFCNDAYLPTLGVKGQWALGAPARRVWAEIWPDIGPRIEQVLRSGESTWDEGLLLFLERSGYPEETYHTFSYSPLADDEGSIVGMLCVVTEETKRLIGERRLVSLRELAAVVPGHRSRAEALEATRRSLNDSSRDLPFTLTYLFDDTGRANLASRSGFEHDHPMAPYAIERYRAPQTWPVDQLLLGRSMVTVGDLGERFRDLPRGGWDKPPREAVVVPIAQQGADSPAGFLVAGINPYRRLDDDYCGFLNLVAGQLAAGLANAQAHEAAQRRADALAELDRAKTAFFSNVSHEFRTPLTLMLGPLEDVLQLPDQQVLASHRQLIQIAHRNGVRLLKLVNTLLDFSRIEAGRVQAYFEPIDLVGYTAELASTFRSAVERAGLELEVVGGEVKQPLYLDRDMWQQIVLNLLSNAFKFTFEGGIRVEIGTARGGGHAEVTVRDTGAGIAPSELPRVFDRFHRVEGARGRSIEGSGIGLALVQELVRAHGGGIRVQSTVGQGSAFTVSLPFGKGHLPQDRVGARRDGSRELTRGRAYVDEALGWLSDSGVTAEVRAIDRSAREPQPAQGGRPPDQRILLADDNPDMRAYLRRLLEEAGLVVEAVGDGEQALEAARRERPDLILSDVMMPRLDGFELLSTLRADPRLQDVPVLLLSARAGEEAKVEGLTAGANDYLVKPFSARELLSRIRANLEIARLRRESEAALRQVNESLERQVTERTAEVRAKEAHLRTIFATSFVFQMLLDPAGRVIDANATALASIRASLGDVQGRALWDTPWFAATPAAAQIIREALGRMLAGEQFQQELVLSLGDGRERWFDFQMRPVHDAAGGLIAILPEAVEITERRLAEEAQRQAQKMESIGHLTGGVAHDFNNLLTIIVGSLDMLKRQLRDPDPKPGVLTRSAESALRGAQRAASLTQRLLAFSRQQPLNPKPVDLGRLVTGMSDLLQRTIGEQIAIETVLAAGLWRTSIDANQLEIAIINLAVNARDAMPEGGKLTIETANVQLDEAYAKTQAEVVPGQYVMLAVSDAGTGMSAETLNKAFEPFFTTKDVGHGTGLGLSQVYGFVKQSGGHLKLYSELGSGTSVKMYLPRLHAEQQLPESETADGIVHGHEGETILAVEDDPDVRVHTVAVLRELGYQVIEAGDGQRALELLETYPQVDLLFTDVGLPGGMNGRQLAEKALARRPALKVLYTTGYARNAIVHDGRLDPGVQLITKPFSFEALSGKLREILDARHGVMRVLIVEDEDLIRRLLAGYVREFGFTPETAGTAAEARDKLKLLNGAVDLAIVDIGLPDARGDALVLELRALYPHLPVIIASGHDRTALQERFAGMGRIEILGKPFTSSALRRALASVGVR